MARSDDPNPMVILEDLAAGRDHLLHVPGWPRLAPVHATLDNHARGRGPRNCHRHAVFHVVVVTAGRGSFLVEDRVEPVTGPTLFLISPEQPHSFQRAAGEDTVYSEVTFQAADGSAPGDWSQLLARWTGTPCALPTVQSIPAPVAAALRTLIARLADPVLPGLAHGATLARGLLHQVCFELWQQLLLAGHAEADPLEQARRFLEANAHRALSLDELARELALSSKHVGRAFRQRFGQPPMHYHRACCLRRAAVLLRTTGHPLKQIATICGFEDPGYFNRAFRQAFGEAPGRYRKRFVGEG
jgi:AraC-like DNA-binding protein